MQAPGSNDLAVLSADIASLWQHPVSGAAIPHCAQAVILVDVARKTTWVGRSHEDTAAFSYRSVHNVQPSPSSVKSELTQLAALLGEVCFAVRPRATLSHT